MQNKRVLYAICSADFKGVFRRFYLLNSLKPMATLKATVNKKLKSGMYVVYIRVTQNRKKGYIRTSWLVDDKGLSRDKKDIKDPYVIEQTSEMIEKFYQRLNRIDTRNWSVSEIIQYLQSGNLDVSFSEFALKHIQKLIDSGHERTSRNYKWAKNHVEKFAGTDNLMFSRMTESFLVRWITTLESTARSKEQYPVCIREIFKAAIKEYNDDELGIVRIKNPWKNIVIPKSDTTEKRAIPASMIRKFFQVVPESTRYKHPLMELGQDVALMSFCMCGINAIDLFNATKDQYSNGIFHYERQKTRNARSDNGYFELLIPTFLQPTFDKYLSKKNDPWLFNFHEHLTTADSFCANINIGIKQICKKINDDFKPSLYSFRHSWATIAQNECGASLGDVDFALNHSMNKMARVYVKIDYSPAWRLNEKVIEFIFFTNKESGNAARMTQNTFRKFSKYNMILAEAFINGKCIAKLENTGFSNIDQVMDSLKSMISNRIAPNTRVQMKITNLDKNQSQMYQLTI